MIIDDVVRKLLVIESFRVSRLASAAMHFNPQPYNIDKGPTADNNDARSPTETMVNDEDSDRKLINAEEGFLGNTVVHQRPPLRRYRNSTDVDVGRDESSSIQDVPKSVDLIDMQTAPRSEDPILVSTSKNATTVNLRDILQNPYEDEAETAIIKAIESRIQEQEESIFPDIPDESQRLFDNQQNDTVILQPPADTNNVGPKNRTISAGDVSLISFRSIKTYQSNTLLANPNSVQPNGPKARADTLSDMAEKMRMVQTRTLDGPSDTGFLARAAKNIPQTMEDRRLSLGGGTGVHIEFTSNNTSTDTMAAPPGFESKSTDSLYKHAEQIYAAHSILRNRLRTESTTGPIPPQDGNIAQDVDPTADDTASPKSIDTEDDDPKKKQRMGSTFRRSIYSSFHNIRQKLILEWEILAPVFKTDFGDVKNYAKRVLILFVIVFILAVILFYGFSNPVEPHTKASYSWWIVFILIRQVITFTLAKVTQYLVIDVIAMKTFLVRRYLGPAFTLFIIQAKGWPFLFITWSAWDFLLLFGDRRFCDHWLYQQKGVALFNDSNPSGNVMTSKLYADILICGIVGGFLGALKKVWVAWFLGRKKFGKCKECGLTVFMNHSVFLLTHLSFITMLRKLSTRCT